MAGWPTPGVYEQLEPPRVEPVVRDDIAGFVGLTRRGPVDVAVYIQSWEEFVARFGERAEEFVLPDVVLSFFLNGGRACYVVRVLDRKFARPGRAICKALDGEKRLPSPPAPTPTPTPDPCGDTPGVPYNVPLHLVDKPRYIDPAIQPKGVPYHVPLRICTAIAEATPAATSASIDAAKSAASSAQASGPATTPLEFVAAQRGIDDPGSWSTGVACAVHFTLRELVPRFALSASDPLRLVQTSQDRDRLPPWGGSQIEVGTLLWVMDSMPPRFAVVEEVAKVPVSSGGLLKRTELVLDRKLALDPKESLFAVEARLEVVAPWGEQERFERLGLSPRHPRYLPNVLKSSSTFVRLDLPDGEQILYPTALSREQPTPPDKLALCEFGDSAERIGDDGLDTIEREDFFETENGYDPDHPERARGLQQLRRLKDVSLVVLPDLVLPLRITERPAKPLVLAAPPACRRVRFVCGVLPTEAEPTERPPRQLRNLIDPFEGGTRTLEDLIEAQIRIVKECQELGDRIALLHAPPSMDTRQTLLWRERFDSAFAAVYHPWLRFGDPITQPPVRLIPPIGVAAGLIASSETRYGVGRAPANLATRLTLALSRAVSDDEWAALHARSCNLFRHLPADIRLLGARTTSSDPEFLYLHVRRLLTHIKRVLSRSMQWVVFEVNTPVLWSRLSHDIDTRILRPLFERKAFAGDTPQTSYFVKCDAENNPQSQLDLGKLTCEIGIAPNIPAEYIVFRFAASRDSGISISED